MSQAGEDKPDADLEINQAALDYHAKPRPGKISVELTKPTRTQRDLALAYTPGVAEPVRRIAADPQEAYRYTCKGNLVGVITNGSAPTRCPLSIASKQLHCSSGSRQCSR